ncbi:MAG: GNAT family N-acetyltransferase [Synergistaceae bacterium]|jgi:predicted GNAT family N-acyltransferase|nr:GNAT family N-acetyltransferase [Synergistaceae bacterium]
MENIKIRKMEISDVEAVVVVGVEAFRQSSFYRYIAPDEKERVRFLETMFRQRVVRGLAQNKTDLAVRDDGKIIGAATWVPPGEPMKDEHVPQLVRGIRHLLSGYSPGVVARWIGFYEILLTSMRKSVQQPFWSLSPVVVLPEEQGKGGGSRLIRKKLEEIGSLPCFLATQSAANRDIYGRYGFRTTVEDRLGRDNGREGDIVSYAMVRPAQCDPKVELL